MRGRVTHKDLWLLSQSPLTLKFVVLMLDLHLLVVVLAGHGPEIVLEKLLDGVGVIGMD